LNVVFFAIIAIAYIMAAFTGNMEAVSVSAFEAAEASVSLVIKLIGYMALFLGIMQVAQDAGLLRVIARAIRPLMVRLFPDVPPEHPAMGAMIMNISANMLGLGNAATPMGIKAMKELDKLNTRPGVATNAMVLFLAINTSGLALLPTGAASIRAAEGSVDPMGIMAPTLFATTMSTIVGISVALWLSRRRRFALPPPEREIDPAELQIAEGMEAPQGPAWLPKLTMVFFLLGIALLVVPAVLTAIYTMVQPIDPMELRAFDLWADQVKTMGVPFIEGVGPAMAHTLENPAISERLKFFSMASSHWVVPTLIMSFITYGYIAKVKVYESFVKGAREGWDTGVRIIPYVIAILVAVAMFRASGAMDIMTGTLGAFTAPLGMPAELIPQAMVRPLSGSGAGALMMENIHTYGPDSYIGYLSSVLNGSTETTFYVLAVYFGSVGVTRVRHAVLAGLAADVAGLVASVAICVVLFGHLA
jgi:spore maturation protein SpmA